MEALGTALPIWAYWLARGNDSGRLVSSSSVVVQELDYVRGGGGKSVIKPEEKPGPGFRGIGVLYCKELGEGQVELKVLYEEHVSTAVRDAIAASFGVGAKSWKVSE